MTATGIQTSLADQMKISEWEANARKKLFGFSELEVSALLSCRTFIGEHVDEIVDAFYEKQTAIREISLLIGDSGTFRRLRASMRQYITELFDGCYDLEYVNKRLHGGAIHKRIGVSPKFYISAVRLLEDLLQKQIEAHFSSEEANRIEDALHKLILFDVQLIFDAYINSMLAEVESANNQLAEYVSALEETIQERTEQLRDLSRKDALTQLFNQRAFTEDLRREVMSASRHLQNLTLVYFDLNGFKELNDTKGHLAGDQVLVNVGQALLEVARDTDFPCRYGGDEFCVILPATNARQAHSLCERLIEAFRPKCKEGVSFSIGIAELDHKANDMPDALINRADTAMYQSKELSREDEGFHITVAQADVLDSSSLPG